MQPLIIVDPGHGGADPGATLTRAGLLVTTEKAANLELSLTLKYELERNGFRVILTRVTDALPGGQTMAADSFFYRCQAQPKSFASVSVHHDTAGAKGGGVYYCGAPLSNPKGAPNPVSLDLAQRIHKMVGGWILPDTAARQGSLAMCRYPNTDRRVLWEAGPVRLYNGSKDRQHTVSGVVTALTVLARQVGAM